MAFELIDKFSCIRVELVDHLVVSTRENCTSVFTELNAGEPTILAGKFLDAKTGSEIPEFGNAVAACRNDEVAAKFHSIDGTTMTSEPPEQFAGVSIPNAEVGVLRA